MEPGHQYDVLDVDDCGPGENLKNFPKATYIFKQDVVRSKEKIETGLVIAVDGDSLTANQVKVMWMDGSQTNENTSDLEVIERRFKHGYYVASASDPTGQLGIVVDLNVTVNLFTLDGFVVENKQSRDLRRIRDFTVGDFVVFGSWLGIIKTCSDNVILKLDDGSVCIVMNADPTCLRPIGKNFLEKELPYYPGQRVEGDSSVFEYSKWLCGSWNKVLLGGTVIKVAVGSVCISWIASSGNGSNSATTPDVAQSPKNLKLLYSFGYTNWGPGDFCLLPSCKDSSKGDSNDQMESTERAFVIDNTSTKVDVVWQDGTTECCMNSTSLIHIETPGDHEFFPEQYVMEMVTDKDDVNEARKVGVVKCANAKDRTACVKWLRNVARADSSRKFNKEEVVSVYELQQHPDHDYLYDDKVVRLSPTENTVDSELSWFGTIIGLKDGDIDVIWADGVISTVGPEEIVVLDDDELIAAGSDSSYDVGSSIEDGMEGADSDEDHGIGETTVVNGDSDEDSYGISDSEDHDIVEASELAGIIETLSNIKLPESDVPPCLMLISQIRKFDIIGDQPLDHHFSSTVRENNASRRWFKKVQSDWDILKNNLPDGIYVRVYEERMNLLRAMIVGARGTPYHDGLFFFDFHLPPDYPHVPPSAYYHSGGWQLNPNLYKEGKVCLSLLNTWSGRETEVWNPTSTILQVLVSLQALVLNAKPYFNEAGYDIYVGTVEGEKSSLFYNENAYLLTCKTMTDLIHKPPKGFEEPVRAHFRERGLYILRECDAYMRGHLIGSFTDDASTCGGDANENSVGFRLMLRKVVSGLFTALMEVGADCQESVHLA